MTVTNRQSPSKLPAGDIFPLDLSAEKALWNLFRHFAGRTFKLDQADAAGTGSVSGADIRAVIPLLLRGGYLSAIRKAWGEKLYYIPLNHLLQLQNVWKYPELEQHDPGAVIVKKEAKPGLALDLFRAMCWIAENGLKMTAKGTVHQKELGKLEARLRLAEEDLAGLALNYPHKDVYPAHLAVVLDMLLSLGLIAKDRAVWQLDTLALDAWLGLGLTGMNDELNRQILRRYVPSDTALQHFAFRLVSPDLREGAWYSLQDVILSLRQQGMIADSLPPERSDWLNSWLKALCGWGWMELGTGVEGQTVFRWLIGRERLAAQSDTARTAEEIVYGEQTGGSGTSGTSHPAYAEAADNSPQKAYLIIQPDFEILVPPDVSFRVRFELESCCDNVTMDVMSVYKINRSTVLRASRHGRTPAQILRFLERYSAVVPDSVRLALEQWGREMGRTAFANKLLLRCADEEAARLVAALPGLSGKIEKIGPLDFIVDPGQETEIAKVLEGNHLSPQTRRTTETAEPEFPLLADGEEPQAAADVRPVTKRGQGWIFSGADLEFYERDHDVPDVAELFPGLNEVPGMWLKEMRKYHSSTARQMISLALKWKTKMMGRIGGETLLCLPVKLEGDADWKVRVQILDGKGPEFETCEQDTLLAPEDWEAMRLIIPGLPK